MSDRFPDGVMAAARELHVTLFDHCRDNVFVSQNLDDIARAILTERERAAKIVEAEFQRGWPDGNRIAEIIRGES